MKTLMNATLALVITLTSFAASASELPFSVDRPLLGNDDVTTESAAVPGCDSDDDGGIFEAKSTSDDNDGLELDEFMGWEDEGRP